MYIVRKISALFIGISILTAPQSLFAEDASSTSETVIKNQESVSVPKENASTSVVVSTKTTTTTTAVSAKCTTSKCIVTPLTKTRVDLTKLSCDIPKNAVLKRGVSDGASYSVTKLQTALVKGGYLTATPNGYFGPATQSAVRKLQSDNALLVSGIVGPYSLAKVNEILCGQSSVSTVASSTTKTESSTKDVADVFDSSDKPIISLFNIKTNTDGVQAYDALVKNIDSLSLKVECPLSVTEVSSLVGLTKQKIADSDSVCKKEKYLFVGGQTPSESFERRDSPLIFIDRDSVSSWFAIDATSSSYVSVPYTAKACKQNVCVQKKSSFEVRDFFQKTASKDLSIDSFLVNSSSKTFSVKASNFSHLTIKPGCPYTVQPVTSAGVAISEDATPCNVEKDIVSDSATVTTSYEKTAESLSQYGLYFILKPVDGSYTDYATVELTLKACTGVQAESVSSTTLKCVEKKGFLTVNQKTLPQGTSTSQ